MRAQVTQKRLSSHKSFYSNYVKATLGNSLKFLLYKFKDILEIFSIENVKLLLVLSIYELGPNKLYVIYWKYVVSAEL